MNYDYYQLDFIGDILAADAELVGEYRFPKLQAQQNIPTGDPLPINYITSSSSIETTWFHHFTTDSAFEKEWKNFDKYAPLITKSAGIITTDFSLYRDYDEDMQIINCRRNRVMAYAMQKLNPNTIPTAGFGGESTWSWCFDGLPENSTVAITTNGVLSDPEARRLFIGGVDSLVTSIHPFAIVVCGNYPDWLNNKYPSVKIIHIPSFGQMWNRRCA